ncbi:MAG: hypothetical protein WA979_14110 [Pacificimonas sp.]
MTEAKALTIAGGAHLALFAVLSLSWSLMGDEPSMFTEPYPVEIVDIADVPTVTAEPEPSLAAAPRETVEAPDIDDAPPLEEAALDDLPDTPTLSELPSLKPVEEKPKPKPDPPAKPKAEAKPKPDPKPAKKQERSTPVDKAKAEASTAREEQDFAKLITDALPTQAKLSSIQQATLAQAIQARIYKCWDPAAGGPDSANIVTTLRVKAAKSGEIIGRPDMVKQTGSGEAGYKRAARDAAIRAVMNPSCSLKGLPPELYAGGWEDFTLNFDPKDF